MNETPQAPAPAAPQSPLPDKNAVQAPTEEKLIWEGSPKWQADFGKLFLAVLIALGGIAATVLLAGKFPYAWAVGLAITVFGIGLFGWTRLERRFQRYRVTNLIVEYQVGVFSTRIENTELWRIRDIGYHQNLFDKILGVATIHLETQDVSDPHLRIEGLPPSRQIYDELKRSIHIARQARNVLGMVG
jgi:uncharacterized membrane protein YdbT with pleckstrin-like domain